jgi:SAM-dependent methyltransferase
VDTAAAWETHAHEWIDWTDPSHQDGFWTTTWPTLRELMPQTDGLVLDLGCGEGRGLRMLREAGHHAIGVDRSPTLVAAAAGDGGVLLGDATRLPIRSGSVAVVFACMSLLDIDDAGVALREVRRVLRPGGVLVAAIVHPFVSAFDPAALQEGEHRLAGPYLTARRYQDRVSRDGKAMTFTSVHRPLGFYVGQLAELGFALDALREAGVGDLPWMLALRARLCTG